MERNQDKHVPNTATAGTAADAVRTAGVEAVHSAEPPIRETTHMDSLEHPIDTINRYGVPQMSSLIQVNSTGRYKEGIRFNSFHYGFDNYCLTVSLSGHGRVKCRGLTRELGRGDVVYTSNYEPTYVCSTDEEWSFCFFNIYGEPCRAWDELWNRGRFEVISTENADRWEDYRCRINQAIGHANLTGALEINRLITDMMTELLCLREMQAGVSESMSTPAWITEAAQYLADNHDGSEKIPAIAERFFLSNDHFTRLFKKYTGKTPKEYQISCRVDEAAVLLRGTALSVAEISSRVGFSSQSLFAEMFRRMYGCTPSEYRKKGAKNR